MSNLKELIARFHELADRDLANYVISKQDISLAADYMTKLDKYLDVMPYEGMLQRVRLMEGQTSGAYLIELRPTAFHETHPHHRILLAKLFEKGDRMVVPIGKVPVTGDIMQIGNLDLEPVQVILRIAPKPGEPVATVYVKVHV
jgi:hypothetical protein